VMCGSENFHPAGTWNGWMTRSDSIMDRPPMMQSYHLLLCQRTMIVIMNPTGM
jgi:hypothetical protein